jgi:glycine cleavage system regulatory protein
VPLFLFLKPQADATVKLIVTDMTKHTHCAGCNVTARMMPLMEGFARVILLAHEFAPAALQPLREYVAWRRGVQEDLRLYYKDAANAAQPLDF